jgi:hypothetical protein
VYSERLESLQLPLPPPKLCQHYHCDEKPNCFTSYTPHFPNDTFISSIVVGETNWTVPAENYEFSDSVHVTYGYQDGKGGACGVGPYAGEIHFRLNIGEKDVVWIFGEYGNGMALSQVINVSYIKLLQLNE